MALLTMTMPSRRRSDGGSSAAADVHAPDAGAWIDRCAARLAELDAELPRDDALRIAGSMHGFERTAAMAPEAAAEFVAAAMRTGGITRFERRGPARR